MFRKRYFTTHRQFNNRSFPHSRHASLQQVDKKEIYLNTLSNSHQKMLTNYRLQLLRSRHCIEANHKVIHKMIADVDQIFQEEPNGDKGDSNCYHRIHKHIKVAEAVGDGQSSSSSKKLDTDRVIVTLKQIVRDWSSDGRDERDACYNPILEAIMEYFKDV